MKTKVAALGLLFLAVLSSGELGAIRYNALFGGTYPGVQLLDEGRTAGFRLRKSRRSVS